LSSSVARTDPMEVQSMAVTRRELLKGAAALGAAGALSQTLPGTAAAQTTQKKELITAQGGDISKLDPHFSTSSNDIRVSFNISDNLTPPPPGPRGETDGAHGGEVQAALRREVPQRGSLQLGRCQVQYRADVRPER